MNSTLKRSGGTFRRCSGLIELKRLAAANPIDAAQQTELDDLQARTDAALAERATPKMQKAEKDKEP